jgi:hypothetical protein
MNTFFASPGLLIGGALAGFVFGFLLQKAKVSDFDTIVGQFLLKDFTVLKVMLTAIVVGGFGVYALNAGGMAALHVKGTALGGNIIGGLIFGVGMAVLGYCPGTAVAAASTGARDALWGILGMLFGAVVYAFAYPTMKTTVLAMGDLGKVTVASLTGVSPLIILAVLAVGALGVFRIVTPLEQR